MLYNFYVETKKRLDFVDLTEKIKEVVRKSKIKKGLCVIFVPHATAAIGIAEGYDENVCYDIQEALKKLFPRGRWRHDAIDGNGDAHIKSFLVSPSLTLIIENGKMILGRWQSILLFDFDGPRKREIICKIMKENKGEKYGEKAR